MTDEERQKLCKYLHERAGIRSDGDAKAMLDAADEIERLEKEVEHWQAEVERLAKELEEAKRYDMRDWNDALERGRKNPI